MVRELLLQEARRLGVDGRARRRREGRRETEEEALIRALVEREVTVPEADEDACRRYYEQNRRRFRSRRHLRGRAHPVRGAGARPREIRAGAARRRGRARRAQSAPRAASPSSRRAHSACPSGQQGGNLGQITAGQTTPEFEAALVQLAPGTLSDEPVATRYGLHIIRLDRRHEGRELPFEIVAERIAAYLTERARRTATAQYIARLVSRAEITGIELAGAEAHNVRWRTLPSIER